MFNKKKQENKAQLVEPQRARMGVIRFDNPAILMDPFLSWMFKSSIDVLQYKYDKIVNQQQAPPCTLIAASELFDEVPLDIKLPIYKLEFGPNEKGFMAMKVTRAVDKTVN